MANTTINTRIILRNDELSSWENSNLKLNSGEIALARREDGSYEMRIGKDNKTWNQLSGKNFMLSADQVIGLEESISQLSTSHYEVGSLDELSSDSYNNGDTAVVKTTIAVGSDEQTKTSYTAYVYDGSLSAWKAMDGNYNADNIYFDYNIVKAGAWKDVGNISHTANTVQEISSTGKSLTEVMDMIFKGDEAFPALATNNKPTCSVTQTSQSVEIGSSVQPKFTMSFDAKKYAYGSNTNTSLNSTTGATASAYTLTYVDNNSATQTLSGNWATSVTAPTSLSVKAGTNSSGAKISVDYNAAASGTYIPRSNLERVLSSDAELTKYRTASGRCTATNNNNSIVGYYPNFYGFKTSSSMLDLDALGSGQVRSFGTAQTESPNATTGKIQPVDTATTTSSWRQFFYALPTGMKTTLEAVDKNGLPLTVKKLDHTVTVAHQGTISSEYDIFYSQQDADYGATTLTLTWS